MSTRVRSSISSILDRECSPFIMICLGSIGLGSIVMDHVVSEPCYIGTILQRNYRKMTILWSFSCNSFVKIQGKKFETNVQHCLI